MSDSNDVIIIGAGHNGLVAAAYLAKAGLQVLVLEARETIGGLAATEEPFPGFRFNTGAHDSGMFSQRIFQDLGLAEQDLSFFECPATVFSPQPDGTALTLWRDIEKSQAAIESRSPADARRFPDYLARMKQVRRLINQVIERSPPIFSDVGPSQLWPWLKVGWQLRRSGKEEMMETLRVLPLPVRDFLDEWFEDDALKGVLAVPSLTGGMPGPYAAGTTFMLHYQQLGDVGGGYRSGRFLAGGSGQLTDALAQVATTAGAEIRTAAGVNHILLDGDRARGVALVDGEAIASQVVVSSLDPRRTFFRLVGGANLMPHFMREVKNIRYGGTTARVNLALSDLPTFNGAAVESQLTGYIVYAPSMEYLERAADAAKYGRISERPVLEAIIPSLLDHSLAPEDRHTMSITVQYTPYHLREGDWDGHREALGDQVVALLSEVAPDLPGLILNRQVITPLDYENEFGLTEGQILHGQMHLDQLFFMRPVTGWANYRTPFENFYLCGSGTHPGGGLTGMPGYLATREILKAWS